VREVEGKEVGKVAMLEVAEWTEELGAGEVE